MTSPGEGEASAAQASEPAPLVLRVSPDELSLLDPSLGKGGVLRIDCADLDRLCDRPDRSQPLARAVGLKSGPHCFVLDATAGLLGDSVLLAALGCRVLAVERSPLISALIVDALDRARRFPRLASVIADRLEFRPGEARDVLRAFIDGESTAAPDVVFLDPMHPPRRKAALVKKEMRVVRSAVGDDADAGSLLSLALAAARRRVVVKQPRLAPRLVRELMPEATMEGRSVRYEVYPASQRASPGPGPSAVR